MSDDANPMVWLYENGAWKQAADPITWSEQGDDVRAKYARAGYTEAPGFSGRAEPARPFLALGLDHEGALPVAQFTLFVRSERPECLIDIEGTAGVGGSTRTVYAARLPDGMDLMARWAPIAQTSALLAVIKDLMTPGADVRGRLGAFPGLVESIARRAREA
jgi:hypothetical protein